MIWQGVRGFLRDTSGAVFVQVALMLMALSGFAGLAIDVGHWYSTQRVMQSAADAAAIAGAYEVMWGGTATAVQDAAKDAAALNGFDPASVTVSNPPSSGPHTTNAVAVEVTIQQPSPGFFSALLMADGSLDISTRSVAAQVDGEPACVMALHPSASDAIESNGSAAITALGCSVHANSTSSTAISVTGGGTISATLISVVGDVASATGLSPTPETAVPPIADPLAYLTAPAYGACDHPATYSVVGGTDTLDPGVYCGGIEISGGADVTFNPGIYVIKDGALIGSNTSNLEGDGVAFYLTGTDAHVDFSGGTLIDFSAPLDGEMEGLIIHQGAGAPAGATNVISDSDQTLYEGTLYFPDQVVVFSGNGIGGPPALHTALIASIIKFTGSSAFTFNSDYAMSSVPAMPALAAQRIALYE